MITTTPPAYVCVGGIIIDDIVMPDGTTHMEILGGGVSHAAAGMLLWDQRPGVIANVGTDLPGRALQRLERDFDLRGLHWLDQPQARAWQLFEWDGKRTEIFRVEDYLPFFYPPVSLVTPDVYRGAKGLYLLTEPPTIPGWRAQFPQARVFWEPVQQYMVAEHLAEFRATLPSIEIVSPNLLEARQMYGLQEPVDLVHAMLDDGAAVVVLRMGEAGSMVGARNHADLLCLPPVPVPEIVDQTGAGNTYCGAFLVGWLETGDLAEAACYGAVAASFALEVTGVADPPADLAAVRAQRAAWLRDRIKPVV